MSFLENWNKKSKEEKNSILVVLILFIASTIGACFAWYWGLLGKVSKSQLAEEYRVEIKILMKWIKLFGDEKTKGTYVGKNHKRVDRIDFTTCLGHPRDYRKVEEGFAYTRPTISKAAFMSERTLLRRIKKIKSPEKAIGMSLKNYDDLKYFPPKQANMLIDHLISMSSNPSQEG